MASATKVVLAPGVNLDDIDDLARDRAWQLTNVLPAGAQRPAQRIFTGPDGTIVYFVEDARLGVTYAAAQGPGAEGEVAAVAGRLDTVAPLTLDAVGGDVTSLAPALGALALAGVEATEGALVVGALLDREEVAVRSMALTALTYCPWPSLQPRLEAMATSDPEPALRQVAAQVSRALYA